jgi:type IV secretion system protein VirB5
VLTGQSVDERVLRGRAEFHSVFSDLAKGKRNWQLAAFGLLGTTVILSIGLVGNSRHSRITPYVVEVDRLGRAQAFGPAEQLRETDQRVVRAELASFVRDIRSVLTDPVAQADLVRRAYAFVDQSAGLFLSQYYTNPANDPRLLGRDLTRLVDVSSVLLLPGPATGAGTATWKVTWTETSLPRGGGGLPSESAWEGYFTTRTSPPTTVDRITVNPLGLYVTSINWTQLAERKSRSMPVDTSGRPIASVPSPTGATPR